MSTEAKKKQEKINRLARRRVEAPPVATAFITPSSSDEAQATWNVRLPASLNLQVRKAMLERQASLGRRVTAREITIEAFEKWLADED